MQVKYHATSKESVVEPFVGQWNMIDKVTIISNMNGCMLTKLLTLVF